MQEQQALLQVRDLAVEFPTPAGTIPAVRGLSYDVLPGEVMGIVGESGSGKSVAAYALMGLLQPPGHITGGQLLFDGQDLRAMSASRLRQLRGRDIGMVFQDPMQGLDPAFTVGAQLVETLRAHQPLSRREAALQAEQLLAELGIRDPHAMMKRYSFELSGGMRQRVLIAIALLCRPRLLVADEPTTALDVTIQEQIMLLLKKACRERHMAMVFITHNFGLVADVCHKVTVMYGGHVMEQGRCEDIFYATAHPYTRGLMRAIPSADLLSDRALQAIEGTPYDPLDPPAGCPFAPRCPQATERCHRQCPPLRSLTPEHRIRCWQQEVCHGA